MATTLTIKSLIITQTTLTATITKKQNKTNNNKYLEPIGEEREKLIYIEDYSCLLMMRDVSI